MKKQKLEEPVYFPGCNVVVQARVLHIQENGTIDIMLNNGHIVFGVEPDEVGLVMRNE
jgi:hypothetical protein